MNWASPDTRAAPPPPWHDRPAADAFRLARRAFFSDHLNPVLASPLQAIPLKARLAVPYFHLQNDEAVTRLVLLPRHATLQQARHWITEQRATGRQLFAVTHRDHGMVGAFGLHRRAELATFHYWIGRPFRGMGHAQHILALLKTEALRLHIGRLYSAVDPDNLASLRALAGAGFHRLGRGAVAAAPLMECVTCEIGADRPSANVSVLRAEANALFTEAPVDRQDGKTGRGRGGAAR